MPPRPVIAAAGRLLAVLALAAAVPARAEFTLRGSVDTTATAYHACVDGTLAYVAGSEDVTIVDVADPAQPTVLGTFAGDAIAASAYTGCAIAADTLLVLASPIGQTRLLRYALTTPTAPAADGEVDLLQYVGAGFDLRGSTAVVTTNLVRWLGGSNDIFEQDGNAVAVDLSSFEAPRSSALYGGVLGGRSNLWRPTIVDGATALVTGSTATGTDTQTGVGRVLVVDVADPGHAAIVHELQIPGTVQAFGIAVDGTRALVAGSTDGWVDFDQVCCSIGGALTLSTIDLSDARNPQLIGTTVTAIADTGGLVTALGGQRFAVVSFRGSGPARLLDVDATDPSALRLSEQEAPGSGDLTFAGDRLYLASAAGLAIYDLGAPPPTSTPSPSPTASPAPATPTETATATIPAASCAGDCNADGTVVVGELIRGVNILLGNVAASECTAIDRNGDGGVAINELIAAVGALLNGCG